jgi:hypothetical protein
VTDEEILKAFNNVFNYNNGAAKHRAGVNEGRILTETNRKMY